MLPARDHRSHPLADHGEGRLDRHYLLVNRTAEEQFGHSREAIVGKTPFDMFPDASRQDRHRTTTARRCRRPDGLFKDEHAWQSQPWDCAISPRPGSAIRDQAGAAALPHQCRRGRHRAAEADEKIAHLAHYDALTDLPNRVLFREQIERELEKVAGGEHFALLYIDIDEFKGINDSLGHHVGDELLKAVAARIRGCLREGDLIARLGGDEFAVDPDRARERRRRRDLRRRGSTRRSAQPYHCLGHQLSTDASIGIAMAPQDGTDLDQLIKNADLAMYGAKADGRRTYRFFEPEMDAQRQGAPARWSRICARRWSTAASRSTISRWSTCATTRLPAARRCCAGAIPSAA